MAPMKHTLILTTLLLAPLATVHAAETKRPNILYIMSDDHTYQAIGAYGSRLAKLNPTPNLDRLAREGIRLDRVFCNNSICSPSRATIISGQYSQANGVLKLDEALPPERQYLPNLMGAAGYTTAIVGKWHLKAMPNFDYYKVMPGQGRYFDPEFYETGKGQYGQTLVKTQGYSTDVITDGALAWLENRDKSKPFFFCLQYKAPHANFENAPRYDNYLADVTIPEPDNLLNVGNHGSIATRGDHDELIHFLGGSVGRRNVFYSQTRYIGLQKSELSGDALTREAYQRYLKKYLRCVKGVDDNVQRVFDYLKREGSLDNTVILYTGDQGMWLGEHDYIDKRWMYEESMRMPLLVRYPQSIKAGSSSKALINNTDFAPTMLDFAGVKTPGYMHGQSFRSILETGQTPADWRSATYYRYWMHLAHLWNPAHFGIRTDRYKLIFFYGINPDGKGIQTPPGWEFYDLDKDPEEMNNCYDDPAYATIIAGLKEELQKLREQYGETDKNYPAVQAIIDKHWNTTAESRTEAVRISHAAKATFEKQTQKGTKKSSQ
jgi:arylsulfatase A-like enzyme